MSYTYLITDTNSAENIHIIAMQELADDNTGLLLRFKDLPGIALSVTRLSDTINIIVPTNNYGHMFGFSGKTPRHNPIYVNRTASSAENRNAIELAIRRAKLCYKRDVEYLNNMPLAS